MPGESKKHHYIPQMILRKFRSNDGKLFYFNKMKPQNGVEQRNPNTIFCERHIYSSIEKDGSKKAILERFFSRMESDAADLLNEIESVVKTGTVPKLTDNQKKFFVDYFYRQWKRSPDVHHPYTSKENFDTTINEILAEEFSGDELEAKLQEIDALTEQQIQRIYQNAKVKALAAGFDDVVEILMSRELVYAVPEEIERNYVISSNPVLRDTYGETSHLRDKTNIVMPISKNLLIGFGYEGRTAGLIRHDREMVRKVNGLLVKQSSEMAGASAKQIQSLIDPR